MMQTIEATLSCKVRDYSENLHLTGTDAQIAHTRTILEFVRDIATKQGKAIKVLFDTWQGLTIARKHQNLDYPDFPEYIWSLVCEFNELRKAALAIPESYDLPKDKLADLLGVDKSRLVLTPNMSAIARLTSEGGDRQQTIQALGRTLAGTGKKAQPKDCALLATQWSEPKVKLAPIANVA